MTGAILASVTAAIIGSFAIRVILRPEPADGPRFLDDVPRSRKLLRLIGAVALVVVSLVATTLGSLFAWSGAPSYVVYSWFFGGFLLIGIVLGLAVAWGLRRSARPWFVAYAGAVVVLLAVGIVGSAR